MIFTSSKDRTASRNFVGSSIDYGQDLSSFHNNRSTQPPQQQLGFFQQLQQSIFGSSQANQHGLNQSRSFAAGDGSQSIVQQAPGKMAIQIFLDLGFKNYTKHQISDDTTAGEIVKNLKQRYGQNQPPATPSNPGNKGGLMQGYQLTQQNSNSSSQLDLNKSYGSASSYNQPQTQRKINNNQNGPKSDINQKDEYGLFLLNCRATNPFLFVRKLNEKDIVYKVFHKAIQEFLRKDFDDNRFKLVFIRSQEIEQIIRQKAGITNNLLEEENHVVSQLGKSIINNKTYERKGKLYKKSLYTDKFKERQFVLDKDQLFYYKNEKQSNPSFTDINLEDKNFNLIMLSNAQIHILENFSKQYSHVFQIENENRKYILSTKSKYDLEQWVVAIQGQIRLSKDNKNIADVNHSITALEKEVAGSDMVLIQKIFKPKNIIFNPVQPILLDFVNDPFINELLPNLTKYMLLVREKEYQRQAFEKAKDIFQQLKQLQKKLQTQLNHETASQNLNESSITDQIDLAILNNNLPEDYKRYKDLAPVKKIQCLFSEEELSQIEEEFGQYFQSQQQNPDEQIQIQLNPKIFNTVLMKINRIIKYSYMDDFFEKKKIELLCIPFNNFKMNMTKMDFNAIGPQVQQKSSKNINIFETMLMKKNQKYNGDRYMGQLPQNQIQIDQNFQHQVRNFIGNLNQDNRQVFLASQDFDVSRLGTVTKVSSSSTDNEGRPRQ